MKLKYARLGAPVSVLRALATCRRAVWLAFGCGCSECTGHMRPYDFYAIDSHH